LPCPVGNNRIDESGEEEGVHKVGFELQTLSNRTTNNSSSSGTEGELKDPEGAVVLGAVVWEREYTAVRIC
jgi:hypothetical protein